MAAITVVQYYFLNRLIKSISITYPKQKKVFLKIFVTAFLIVVDIYPVVVMGTNLYTILNPHFRFTLPENSYFDYLVMYPSWIGILIVIQIILIFNPIDIVSAITKKIFPTAKEKLLRIRSKAFFLILGFFIIYLPVRVIYDHNQVEIRNVTYKKSNLAVELDGFKIALIADIQADRFTNETRLNRFVEKVNSTKPDLVLIAGDMITTTPLYIELAAE
ncbi:MAG: metallophosphoesterase, partial [Bacteroidetes bacterium]|nr:metallophosphoesterase [Bacteroidota bacterium]